MTTFLDIAHAFRALRQDGLRACSFAPVPGRTSDLTL